MEIRRVEEFMIDSDTERSIRLLFANCFDGYPLDRIYYNQLPDFRFLAYESKELVGHLAVNHRIVSVDQKTVSVFGIIDLCVAGDKRSRKVGSALLGSVEDLATEYGVEFLLLTTETEDIYLKNGFTHVNNPCTWFVIHNNRTFGALKRTLEEGLMVKPIGGNKWPDGSVDLLGHMF
jgi:predicted N-acetyltransferase YhbS